MKIIEQAVKKGLKSLSEYDSKRVLSHYGFPVVKEKLVESRAAAAKAAKDIGLPVVLKACSPAIAHKTEKKLIEVDLRTLKEVERAYTAIMERVGDDTQLDGILVQQMIKGSRELMVGLLRDPQFGPCVMFGLGGIFTEILRDIAFRVAPLDKIEALDMMQEIKARAILGAVRGMPPADMDVLADILIKVGMIGLDLAAVKEIDINPIILSANGPVAVDALIVLNP